MPVLLYIEPEKWEIEEDAIWSEKWEIEEGEANKPIQQQDGKESMSRDTMKEAANDIAGKLNFQSVITNLQSTLQSPVCFVLPGSQQFFKNNGDLMVEATNC